MADHHISYSLHDNFDHQPNHLEKFMKKIIRRLRLYLWFFQAFFQKHRFLLFLGFFAGFLLFLGLIKLVATFSIPLNIVRTRKIAVIGNFSPTNLPANIQNYLSLGLTSVDENGHILPSLATKWEIKDEGKTYLFYLKNNVFWHDKTLFTAGDVNYNLKDVKLEALGNEVVKISLKEPFSPLLSILSRPIFKKGLIGLGPYKVKRLILKEGNLASILLEGSKQNLTPLEFKIFASENLALTAFKLGEVNVLEKVNQIVDFNSSKNVKITSFVYPNFNIMLFYNNRLPFLADRTNRQALSYAVPVLSENQSFGPLNPNSWAYYAKVKDYSYNLEQAKELYQKGKTASPSADLTISTFPSFLNLAQEITASWKKLGVKTQIKVENALPSEFDVLIASQEIPSDPDQYHLWHSTQTTNLTGLTNPRIDKLLEDGRKTQEEYKRIKIYQDFQRYLLEEAPAVFLLHPKLYTIERI